MMRFVILTLMVFAFLLTNCTQEDEIDGTIQVAERPPSNENTPTTQTIVATKQNPTESTVTAQTETQVEATAVATTATEQPEATAMSFRPIEVTYFTPAQAEGPYYTVDKPADRDNDLTDLEGAAGSPAGEIIEFGGKLYDAAGLPVPGAVIEIWQTDNNGVYLHPNDPGTEGRDRNFQFYGEAVTGADGSYSFRTILPGHYEPRPRHIHVKVRLEGQELLTTQFYFEGDPELTDESMLNQTDSAGAHLIISLAEGQDVNGNSILMGQRDIILSKEISQ